jgi:hypothetical protein
MEDRESSSTAFRKDRSASWSGAASPRGGLRLNFSQRNAHPDFGQACIIRSVWPRVTVKDRLRRRPTSQPLDLTLNQQVHLPRTWLHGEITLRRRVGAATAASPIGHCACHRQTRDPGILPASAPAGSNGRRASFLAALRNRTTEQVARTDTQYHQHGHVRDGVADRVDVPRRSVFSTDIRQ